jgi:hypothetical protein
LRNTREGITRSHRVEAAGLNVLSHLFLLQSLLYNVFFTVRWF